MSTAQDRIEAVGDIYIVTTPDSWTGWCNTSIPWYIDEWLQNIARHSNREDSARDIERGDYCLPLSANCTHGVITFGTELLYSIRGHQYEITSLQCMDVQERMHQYNEDAQKEYRSAVFAFLGWMFGLLVLVVILSLFARRRSPSNVETTLEAPSSSPIEHTETELTLQGESRIHVDTHGQNMSTSVENEYTYQEPEIGQASDAFSQLLTSDQPQSDVAEWNL